MSQIERAQGVNLAGLRAALVPLLDDITALDEAGDWETLVRGSVALSAVQADLAAIQRDAKRAAAKHLPGYQTVVPGLGTVKRVKDKKTTWDNKKTMEAIVGRVVARNVDMETGEFDGMAAVLDLAALTIRGAGIPYWRKGGLPFTKDEIEALELVDTVENGYTVQLPKYVEPTAETPALPAASPLNDDEDPF